MTEAEFLSEFRCPEGASSGIDFAAERLRVTVIREAGFTAPTRGPALRGLGDEVVVTFVLPVYCGGAFPPTAVLLTVLPSGTGPVADSVCSPGNCGGGGAPP